MVLTLLMPGTIISSSHSSCIRTSNWLTGQREKRVTYLEMGNQLPRWSIMKCFCSYPFSMYRQGCWSKTVHASSISSPAWVGFVVISLYCDWSADSAQLSCPRVASMPYASAAAELPHAELTHGKRIVSIENTLNHAAFAGFYARICRTGVKAA